MVDSKDKIENGDTENESGFDGLGEDYLASVQEQIKKFTEDPEILQQALKPFMEMQRQYMENPEKLAKLAEAGKSQTDEMLDIMKRIRARMIRLEKRLEEAGVIKPLEN